MGDLTGCISKRIFLPRGDRAKVDFMVEAVQVAPGSNSDLLHLRASYYSGASLEIDSGYPRSRCKGECHFRCARLGSIIMDINLKPRETARCGRVERVNG